MAKKGSALKSDAYTGKRLIYDGGTIKVVVFACLIILIAVVLTGAISYFITRAAVVERLKSHDLIYMLGEISAKIDGRIERAQETALLLSRDQAVIQWIVGAEQDEQLGIYSKRKIDEIARDYDYANAFIVSTVTGHYWTEGSRMVQVMSKSDPNAKWFYDAIASGKAVDVKIDYNSDRQEPFVFVNTLVGTTEKPIAVAGVGLRVEDLAEEFRNHKFSESSKLWLVDEYGKIHLSDDLAHTDRSLREFVPEAVFSKIMGEHMPIEYKSLEYTDTNGEIMDMAYKSTKSKDFKLVLQIPRNESIAVLSSIKANTAIAGTITLLLMIFVFYVISRQIADPLKRAIQLTEEMESQVEERTKDLAEKNQEIMDSITYAKRLQEAILATPEDLDRVLGDYFILWKPRDTVGGDFYWAHHTPCGNGFIAVVDCTGHGVPGAFMTMVVNAALHDIVVQGMISPAEILTELNRRVKAILHRSTHGQITDDGLDIGICYVDHTQRQVVFAGAKLALYIKQGTQVRIIKGDKQSIGYRSLAHDLRFADHKIDCLPGDYIYMTTDGYIDQNGGSKNYSLGRTRLLKLISAYENIPMVEQGVAFEAGLKAYMGNEQQRDDITMVGFLMR